MLTNTFLVPGNIGYTAVFIFFGGLVMVVFLLHSFRNDLLFNIQDISYSQNYMLHGLILSPVTSLYT